MKELKASETNENQVQYEIKLKTVEHEAKLAREETELTLLQLHQVEEELYHYFHEAKAGKKLADAQQHQLQRAKALVNRLIQTTIDQTKSETNN